MTGRFLVKQTFWKVAVRIILDNTYIPRKGGSFCYFTTLMDLCSRRIVGWELGDDMTDSLVLDALRLAIKARSPKPGLVHHTDRGGQYVSNAYKAMQRRVEIR